MASMAPGDAAIAVASSEHSSQQKLGLVNAARSKRLDFHSTDFLRCI
jgi:hypothetical protein